MKLLLCLLITFQLDAQKKNTNTNWITFKSNEQVSVQQLTQNKTKLQLETEDALQLMATQEDQLGYRHYRYQQTHKGIPIEGAIYLMHEKNNRVQHANGNLIPKLQVPAVPAITEATALASALEHVNASKYAWQETSYQDMLKQVEACTHASFYPTGELVIIDPNFGKEANNYRLAFKFDVYAVEPLSRQKVYVDAQTGAVIHTVEQIHNCNDVGDAGSTHYSGTVNFTACESGGTHILKNNIGGGMQVFNANNSSGSPQIPFTDPDGFFEGDPAANEVHWATQKTYEYYLTNHGRNSLDGNGMALYSWVHFRTNYNNAFWNGSWMTYGDGDNNTFSSLTAPDVVAHEMTHGVTEFSAGLHYSYESGALNESFSDIFGEIAEAYSRGNNDWIMGADFTVRAGKNGLRNMSNPNDASMLTRQPDTYLGDFWYTGPGDNGGVHYNSGVQNYWFYLLTVGGSGTNDNGDDFMVNGIGMTKAAAIAYRNLTVYLNPTSQYADARAGAIQAAVDLYGAGSNEAIQTEAAWCAVGVGTCTSICVENDYVALRALYLATDGDNWTDNTGWPTTAVFNANPTPPIGTDVSTWYGVEVNTDGCVTCLDMDGNLNCQAVCCYGGNNLIGTIPTEIGNLSNLTHLSLSSNGLMNAIPASIGDLNALTHLNLADNNLSGAIPATIDNLTELSWLNLSTNNLSGTIPDAVWNLTNLTNLYLNNNNFTGSISANIGNLQNLSQLYLSDNNLSGMIPESLGNLSNLLRLYLQKNNLTGSIPATLGNLTGLDRLYLNNNDLSGCFPEELTVFCNINYSFSNNLGLPGGGDFAAFCNSGAGACTPPMDCTTDDYIALRALYLSTDGDNWTNNTGWPTAAVFNVNPTPPNGTDLGTWHGVTVNVEGCVTCLDLDGGASCSVGGSPSGNNLVGTIPQEIGNLSQLTNLYLSNNELTGSIPSSLGNLTNLTYLLLSNNQLSGSIPSSLGDLSNLNHLLITNNLLSGSIPTSLGNLSNLNDLWLGSNDLTGSIPADLGDLLNLKKLFIDKNQLSGAIPASLGNLMNLTSLWLHDNQLSGPIPPDLGGMGSLNYLYLHDNQLSGLIPSGLGSLASLKHLHLYNNQLNGQIPLFLIDLTNLTSLYLYNNQLSGCYNSDLASLCNQLTYNTNHRISDGNNFDAPWEDFCNNGAGACIDTPVWPGDFNNDGTAEISDLLYWAIAEGITGNVRPNATMDWTAQACPDWENEVNGINGKHQDGNGNGIIDNDDLQALVQNYDNTHTIVPQAIGSSPITFSLELLSSIPSGNTTTKTFALFATSSLNLPISMHGFSCSIDLSQIPSISSVMVNTVGSSLQPDVSFDQYMDAQKRLDIALSRTDKVNHTINGALVEFIIIEDDIPGGGIYALNVANGNIMSSTGVWEHEGVLTAVGGNTIYSAYGGFGGVPDLSVSINITHEQCNSLGQAEVIPSSGVAPYSYAWSNGATTAQVSDLVSGLYSVTVSDNDGLSKVIPIQISGAMPIYDAAGNLLCGSACPDYLTPVGGLANGLYNASKILDSKAIIPAGNSVEFKAGQEVLLEAGFTVELGAELLIEIEDCGGN